MKPINKKIKRFWGVSEVGFSVMSMMETSFLLFFLTDVAKLPLDMAAFITSTAAIADAICAVPSGIVIDKLSFRSGKYRPWLLICPPVVTLLFVLCFTRIGSDTLTCAIIITAYVLSHFIWTIAWNANRSLISVLTEDPQEKNFLSGRIAVGTSLGKILASFLIPFLSVQIGKRISGVASYTVICAISCVLFVICYYVHYAITKGYDTDTSYGGRAVTFRDMLRSVTGNGNLIAILAHDAIRLVAFFGIAASAAYYAKIVIGDAGALTWILLMFYAGSALGANFSGFAAGKLGVKGASALGCAACALLHGVCYFSEGSLAVTAILLFLAQCSFGIAYGLTSKLYSMCGTYSEWKTGENTQGVIMSFCSLSIKISIALRGVLITAILGWIHYDPAMTVVSDSACNGIKVLFFLVFGAIMLLSLIPLIFFRLSDEKMAEMEKEIAERRKTAIKI